MKISDPRYRIDRVRHAWQRHRLRAEIDRIYAALVGSLDQRAFTETLRPYWDPFAGAAVGKYLAVDVWLKEAIFRYLYCAAGRGERGPVVDLGSGTGYFLWVCREHGHEILGIDIGGEPLYDACCRLLDIPRIEYRIEPFERLLDTRGDLSLVTAFMACFERLDDGRPWSADAWRFFLSDVRSRLRTGGRLVVSFNAWPDSGELYSREVHDVFRAAPGFRFRRFLNYATFNAQ